jgi:outer membrane protein TolC
MRLITRDGGRDLVRGWRALSAGAVLGLSSCATTGSRQTDGPAVVVPPAWQHGATFAGTPDPAVLATWWERFNDPVLDALIAGALRSSPDVRTALSKIAEYRARRGVQRAARLNPIDALRHE